MRPQYPYTVYSISHHTPLGRFSKLDCSTTQRVPIPNDAYVFGTLSVGSFPTSDLFGTDTIPNCGGIDREKSAQGGVMYTVVYGTLPNTPVWFGTELIPVPNTSVSSVRKPKMPRVPLYPSEHTLVMLVSPVLMLRFCFGRPGVRSEDRELPPRKATSGRAGEGGEELPHFLPGAVVVVDAVLC